MAKHTFVCKSCGTSKTLFTSSAATIECESCGEEMSRKMPTLNGKPDVTETVDSYTGIKHREDHKNIVEQRKQDYFWKHEVPRLVNSGTYSLETMISNGWVTTNDKDELIINTKPPNRR